MVRLACSNAQNHCLVVKSEELAGIFEIHVDRDVVILPVKRSSNIVLPGLPNDDLVLPGGLGQQVWRRIVIRNTALIDLDDAHRDVERGLVDEVIWWTFSSVKLRVDKICFNWLLQF